MRLVKSQTTDSRFFGGLRTRKVGVNVEPVSDRIDLVSTNAVVVPTGEQAERSNVPVEGMIRYNTDTNEIEAYQNAAWRNLRFKEPTTIVKETLGAGTGSETVFGPLDDGSGAANTVPVAAEHLIVYIGNVIQLAGTQYTLHPQSEITTGGSDQGPNHPYNDPGYYIKFASAVPFGSVVTVLHNFDK